MDKLKEFHPLIVSHKQFYHDTTNAGTDSNATFVQRICHQKKKFENVAEEHGGCVEGTRTNFNAKSMDPMMEAAIQRSHTQKTIIEIYSYWKSGWHSTYNGQNLVKDELFPDFLRNKLPFKPEIYDFVDTILKEAGIQDGKYSVIQWRAEHHKLDHVTCAKHIITARDIMTENNGTHNATPFVLISSLNRNESMTWNTKVRGTDTQDALNLLIDTHGFIKLDSFLSKHPDFFTDNVFLAVVDLILAEKAQEFATCDKSCSKAKDICTKCGHLGQFVVYAEQLRSDNGRNSTSCWPERK
jgi:hypothetical protein